MSLALAVPTTDRLAAPFVQPTTSEEAVIPFGGRTLAADLYRPQRPRGAILLVHGLSPAGRRQTDLVRLAGLLARHGQLALVPQLDSLAAFRLDGSEVAAIGAALDHVARLGIPLAVAGFSFGAGPALLAVARRPGVRLVGSFGGYADLRSVIAFVTTGPTAESYNRWKLLQLLTGFVENAPDRVRLGAIAQARLANPGEDTTRLEVALGEDGRGVLALVHNRRADAVGPLLDRLSPSARVALDRLSPLPVMSRLRGNVLIAHGREDTSIPYGESLRLAEAAGTHAIILDTFHHTGPRPVLQLFGLRALDAWKLVRLADALLAG